MKSHCDYFIDASIQAALSAIEIYNKPNFLYREQTFTMLIVNAWELALKAHILQNNGDNLESIFVKKSDGSFKINRSGNTLTVEITGAMKMCALDVNVVNNIERLIELRDTTVHFYHDSDLSYIVYTLATASLKNFYKLIQDWFGRSLAEYNLFVMPLSFAYNFQTLSAVDVSKKPEAIANIIKGVTSDQDQAHSTEFDFVCEIMTKLVSAKKFTGNPDIIAQIDTTSNSEVLIVERLQRLMDKYPLSYNELRKKIKEKKPHTKQHELNKSIVDLKIKGNDSYSSYSFSTKQQKDKYEESGYISSSHTCIYNEDALKIILEDLK